MFDTLGDGGEEPVTPALTDITDAAPLLALDPHTVSASGLVEGIEALLDAQNLIAAALCRWTQAADVTGATVDECGRTTRGFLVEELRRSPHGSSLSPGDFRDARTSGTPSLPGGSTRTTRR
jgi:hypothetical protein